jgi:hypothetical protein
METLTQYEMQPRDVLMLSILVLFLGFYLNRKIRFLSEYYIPPAVTGGLICSIIVAVIYGVADLEVTFDMRIRDVLLLVFFSTIGLTAKLRTLGAGGKALAAGRHARRDRQHGRRDHPLRAVDKGLPGRAAGRRLLHRYPERSGQQVLHWFYHNGFMTVSSGKTLSASRPPLFGISDYGCDEAADGGQVGFSEAANPPAYRHRIDLRGHRRGFDGRHHLEQSPASLVRRATHVRSTVPRDLQHRRRTHEGDARRREGNGGRRINNAQPFQPATL